MNRERLMKILLEPRVSEKATLVADQHKQFVFRVLPDATKPEIRKAVEQLFDVQVDRVQVVSCRGKVKRFGASYGKQANYKKAYVGLKPGFDIDFMDAQ